jgi:hypothetical protein
MKRILFLFFAVFALMACSQKTPQQKAEAAVKQYLQKNMDDPSSYEPVEFGKLDSAYSTLEDDSAYIAMNAEIAGIYPETIADINKKTALQNNLTKYISSYKNKWTGYTITHKARAKNKLGALVMENLKFTLDKNFNVKKTEEIN